MDIVKFVIERFSEASEPYMKLLGLKKEEEKKEENKEVVIVEGLELRAHRRLP